MCFSCVVTTNVSDKYEKSVFIKVKDYYFMFCVTIIVWCKSYPRKLLPWKLLRRTSTIFIGIRRDSINFLISDAVKKFRDDCGIARFIAVSSVGCAYAAIKRRYYHQALGWRRTRSFTDFHLSLQ